MEGLQIGGCLHRALAFRSKTLLCSCSLPLLLLLLLLLVVSPRLPPHWENPMLPTVYWHALSGLCEAPAFAFLLLNCLIVTIIASSKLQSEKRGGQERESARSVLERDDAKSAYHVAENVVGQTHDSSAKYADDIMFHEGRQFLRSSCSLDAHYKREIRQEPVSFDLINDEKKPVRRATLGSSWHNSNKSLSSSLREKKLMRGSFSLNAHDGKPALQEELGDPMDIEIKSIKRPGHPGNIIDRQPRQASNSTATAATAHSPSLEEVWKAIVLSDKGDDAMVCMQADQKCCNDIPPQPAADTDALSLPAAAAPSPAAHSPRRAIKVDAPAKAQGRATMKQERGDDQESDSETLEELNRRAEEFIARFNRQMRLQRQESLQRQRGLRACTQYDLQRPHHLQLPVRGLLVGT